MKKYREYIKHGIIGFIAAIVLVSFGLYIYLTKSVYWEIDKKDRIEIVSAIKSASVLPDRFYYIYNKIYPNSLEKRQLYYFFNRDDGKAECPCRLAGYKASVVYDIHLANLVFWLENEVSQNECLNYFAAEVDLLDNTIGVLRASGYYFNKKLEDLTDYEFIELIVMIENPSLYNKKRNADRLKNRVTEIITRINL
jgi:hypothetical protein